MGFLCRFTGWVFLSLYLLSSPLLAAEYNDGDACAVSGAFHTKNDTEGLFYLICNGTTWEDILFLDKDLQLGVGTSSIDAAGEEVLELDVEGDVGALNYCDEAGNDCFDANYVKSGLIRPVPSAAAPVFSNDLNDIYDVDSTGVADGECIVYNITSGFWEPGACGAAASVTTAIELVATADAPLFQNDLGDLTDVDTTGVLDGQCVVYNSTSGDWEIGACGSGGSITSIESVASADTPLISNDLDDLTDVNTSGVINGECLAYNSGSGDWEVGACGGGSITSIESVASADTPVIANDLNDITNVSAPGPADGDCLVFSTSSGNWETGVCGGSTTSVEIVASADVPVTANDMDDLDDVAAPSPGVNDVLIWNGTNWVSNAGIPSDKRLKQDIQPVSEAVMVKLKNLDAVTYQMIEGDGRMEFGFIAQDVEGIYPNLVSDNASGYKSLNYIGLVPLMVEAINGLNKENEALKARVDALETIVLEGREDE